MRLHKSHPTGLEYLARITGLLHRIRREDRFAGLYEAADLQWWWREDDASDPARQIFWHDDAGPVAAVLLHDSGNEWNCDFFALPSLQRPITEEVLPEVIAMMRNLSRPSTITVRDDDCVLRATLESHGWHASGDAIVQAYLAADLPRDPLPSEFRFQLRADRADRPHPMTARNRNPPDVESRLSQCSLYRSDLDYAVVHSSGEVAAYALFWMDKVTNVGLIEPMRTEDAYQRRGLGSALLCEGVRRLRSEGADTIRVSYSANNQAARKLYHRCGFRDVFRKLEYRKVSSEP